MRIVISFDTEDFTDPASNDVLLRLCRLLTERGVRACFGLVGEKARFLRDQGRRDVVAALAEHSVCYHTDNHLLFPDARREPRFAAQIVEECDWDEAVEWLTAVEARGLGDIEDLFGRRPTTFLRTCGDSAPQLLEAHRRLGIRTFAYGPCMHEKGGIEIAYYANLLFIALPILSEEITYAGNGPARLDELAANADLINVRFHPCRFLTDTWWSIINFAGTWDPPVGGPYRLAPHLASKETDQRLARLAALVDYARDRHGATFTTYDDLTAAVATDPPFLSRPQVRELARALQSRLAAVTLPGLSLSPAEGFGAVIWAALHPAAEHIPLRHLVGPTALPPEAPSAFPVTCGQLLAACQEAERHLARAGRVPDAITIAGRPAGPASLLRAAAARVLGECDLQVAPAPALPEGLDHLYRGWDGFADIVALFPARPSRDRTCPNTQLAVRLQYWTYKPAL
jgi:hypothetical protein